MRVIHRELKGYNDNAFEGMASFIKTNERLTSSKEFFKLLLKYTKIHILIKEGQWVHIMFGTYKKEKFCVRYEPYHNDFCDAYYSCLFNNIIHNPISNITKFNEIEKILKWNQEYWDCIEELHKLNRSL